MDADDKLTQLKQSADQCKADPSILTDPSPSFFQEDLESLGAELPSSANKAGESGNKSNPDVVEMKENEDEPQPKPFVVEEEEEIVESESDGFYSFEMESESESDVDLEGEAVQPHNDPQEKMGDSSHEGKGLAMVAISEGKLVEAIDNLTKAITLNQTSAIMYATRVTVYIKMKKPNAAASAAFEIHPDSAEGYTSRGMEREMLDQWEQAAKDLHVTSNTDFDEEIQAVMKKDKHALLFNLPPGLQLQIKGDIHEFPLQLELENYLSPEAHKSAHYTLHGVLVDNGGGQFYAVIRKPMLAVDEWIKIDDHFDDRITKVSWDVLKEIASAASMIVYVGDSASDSEEEDEFQEQVAVEEDGNPLYFNLRHIEQALLAGSKEEDEFEEQVAVEEDGNLDNLNLHHIEQALLAEVLSPTELENEVQRRTDEIYQLLRGVREIWPKDRDMWQKMATLLRLLGEIYGPKDDPDEAEFRLRLPVWEVRARIRHRLRKQQM